MHVAAAFPERRTQRRDTRAAGALLFPEFSSRAGKVTTSLGGGRALTRVGHEISHGRMNQTLIQRHTKNSVRQLDLANFFILYVAHLHCRHNPSPFPIADFQLPIFGYSISKSAVGNWQSAINLSLSPSLPRPRFHSLQAPRHESSKCCFQHQLAPPSDL